MHWLVARYRILNRFFISSPHRVLIRSRDLFVGAHEHAAIWPYLGDTVGAALEGFLIGSILGFLVGLVLSNSERLNDILGVFLVGLNSVPKVAILPIIVVMVGVGDATVVVSSTLVVFFMMFFNCLEGGRSVPPRGIRQRAGLWCLADHADAAYSRALCAPVGVHQPPERSRVRHPGCDHGADPRGKRRYRGPDSEIGPALLDATGAITLAVYLGVTGFLLLRIAELLKRRVLHWADSNAQFGSAR